MQKGQVRRLKAALRWNGDPQRRQRIQMVLLRECGMTQPAIAEAMGVSLSTVNRAHMAYDGGGLQALKSKPSGGRKRENMTLAEERVLLARFAKAAGAGDVDIDDLKAAYERDIGHATSNSTVYNLLARHGWRKPYAASVSSRNATSRLKTLLKKRLSTAVRKARQAAARRGRRLRIMFADEVRFGRIENRPWPCCVPRPGFETLG